MYNQGFGYGMMPPWGFPTNPNGEPDLRAAIKFLEKMERKRLKKEDEIKKKKEPKPLNIPVGVCMAWITILSLPVGIGQLWLIKYLAIVLKNM